MFFRTGLEAQHGFERRIVVDCGEEPRTQDKSGVHEPARKAGVFAQWITKQLGVSTQGHATSIILKKSSAFCIDIHQNWRLFLQQLQMSSQLVNVFFCSLFQEPQIQKQQT
jgi:hypothetical protein